MITVFAVAVAAAVGSFVGACAGIYSGARIMAHALKKGDL